MQRSSYAKLDSPYGFYYPRDPHPRGEHYRGLKSALIVHFCHPR